MHRDGVIYFNCGSGAIVRLAVSLHSLRKHWKGEVGLLQMGPLPDVVKNVCDHYKVEVINVPEQKGNIYLKKIKSNIYSPYQRSFYIDADTLIVGDISPAFKYIRKYGLVFSNFAEWITTGKTVSKRIRGWNDICPELIKPALEYGGAINVGTYGFTKDHPFMDIWIKYTTAGEKKKNFIPDELAAQILAPHFDHFLLPQDWNISVRYGNMGKDPKVIHYHGKKHCKDFELCKPWKKAFFETCQEVDLPSEYYDKRLVEWLTNDGHIDKKRNPTKRSKLPKKEEKSMKDELTVVCAVDRKYVKEYKKNIESWKANLIPTGCELLVLHDKLTSGDLEWIQNSYDNVRLVPIDAKAEEVWPKPRDRMLTAFIRDTAGQIKTPYWLKIDTDARVSKNMKDKFAEWIPHDLFAHKWGYTKPGQWLVDLDNWADSKMDTVDRFKGSAPLFDDHKACSEQRRYGHRRIASFCCLHSTKFTEWAAEICDFKPPVPSHDTYLWYVAKRGGWIWGWTKMKQWIDLNV